jgi:hypothetical protein
MTGEDVRDDVARRRRWSRALWLVLPVLAAAIVGAAFVLMSLRVEPEFYREARRSLADEPTRRQAAQRFEEKSAKFARSLDVEGEWMHEFTQDEINAWLLEGLPNSRAQLPQGVSEPLVQFGGDVIQVGCRVETKQYRGILSIAVRPSIDADGDVILTLQRVRAGELDVPARQLLDEVSKSLRKAALPIELERGEEERVVVDLHRAAPDWRDVALTSISVGEGRVTFRGRRDADEPAAPPETPAASSL